MSVAEAETWTAVESLYRKEARLLQGGRYLDWLQLLTADIRYRAPVVRVLDHREDSVAGPSDLAYYDEDRESLELRVNKLASTMAWTEYPPSRLRYFFQVTEIASEGSELVATSNFLVFQTRHESHENTYYGERTDRLREVDGELAVADRVIVLDRARLPSENLSLFF
ncbi:MAG: aromatic-ring-hydroxylating dioxygenase subunit beta [Actinobacteria bacterium]|nr:aromatic-ring-hydroxylating dioxygenase subunit beta [Actinomycetota bacterium]